MRRLPSPRPNSPLRAIMSSRWLRRAQRTERTPLQVHVEAEPPKERLDVVYTKKYTIDSPLWNARAKALIVNWIPHCIDAYQAHRSHARGQGGIDNFIEAGKTLRGEPHGTAQGLRLLQRLGASDRRVDVHRADGRSEGRSGDHRRRRRRCGRRWSDWIPENPRRAGAGRLSADRLHARGPQRLGRSAGRPDTRQSRRLHRRATSSNRRSTITR